MRESASLCAAAGLLALAVVCAGCAGSPADQSPDSAPLDDGQEAPGIEATSQGMRLVPSTFVGTAVFLDTAVEGRPGCYPFVLDTGAAYSAIDERLARELMLDVPSGLIPGDTRPPYLLGTTLDVAGERFEVPRLYTVALTPFSDAAGLRIGGILGTDFLLTRVVRIDYGARQVGMGDAAAFMHDGRGDVLPVVAEGNVYLIATAKPHGGEERGAGAILDTGSNGAVSLSEGFAEKLKLTRSPAGLAVWFGGEMRVDTARLADFRLGKFSFEGCTVVIQPSGIPAHVDASIGSGLLSRFTVTLDFSRGRVILEPGPTLDDPLGGLGMGFGVATLGSPYDRFVVRGLIPGLPGSLAGLQEQDEILEVDGQSAVELGIDGISNAIKRAVDESTPVMLTVRRDRAELMITVHPPDEPAAAAPAE